MNQQQRRSVNTTGKGVYTMMLHNIYGVPWPQPEERHRSIDSRNTIVQGMQNKSYEMRGMAQANSVLTSSNSVFMAQLAQTTATMNVIQAQLETLFATSTIPTITKRKYYYWSCRSNYNNGRKIWSSKKTGHKEEVYHKKRLRGSEKWCEWWLGVIMNKIQISTPKISLINNIVTLPNSPTVLLILTARFEHNT